MDKRLAPTHARMSGKKPPHHKQEVKYRPKYEFGSQSPASKVSHLNIPIDGVREVEKKSNFPGVQIWPPTNPTRRAKNIDLGALKRSNTFSLGKSSHADDNDKWNKVINEILPHWLPIIKEYAKTDDSLGLSRESYIRLLESLEARYGSELPTLRFIRDVGSECNEGDEVTLVSPEIPQLDCIVLLRAVWNILAERNDELLFAHFSETLKALPQRKTELSVFARKLLGDLIVLDGHSREDG